MAGTGRTLLPVLRRNCAAWLHANLTEIGDALSEDLGAKRRPWLLLVPVVNLVVVLGVWRDVDRFIRASGGEGFSPWLHLAISFIPGGLLFAFIDVQTKLNGAWRRRLGGSAVAAPLGRLGRQMICLNIAIVLLSPVLFFLIASALLGPGA